jgi:hypothetical protein
MSDRTDLVAIPRPSAVSGAVLRATRIAEEAVGSLLGSVEALTSRVAAEVVQAVMTQLDVNAILERVDVDALLERVDVDRLLDQVDVDRLLERVDVDRIVSRVQLTPIVAEVLDEIDIGSIVMESTGSITGGVVDSVRVQAIDADERIERLLDAVFFRRRWQRRGRES